MATLGSAGLKRTGSAQNLAPPAASSQRGLSASLPPSPQRSPAASRKVGTSGRGSAARDSRRRLRGSGPGWRSVVYASGAERRVTRCGLLAVVDETYKLTSCFGVFQFECLGSL